MSNPRPETQYNAFATQYSKLEALPGEILATLGLRHALANPNSVSGLRVLDLGGGSGTYARLAVTLGAAHVTCVDISSAMAQQGNDTETAAADAAHASGRSYKSKIEYFTADCALPLSENLPSIEKGSYDLVMGNWVLNYADSATQLEGMWLNIATYCRPGGRFIGLINLNAEAQSMLGPNPKYGIQSEVVGGPGADGNGAKVHVTAHTSPPIEFDAFILDRRVYDETPLKCGMAQVDVYELKEEVLESGADLEFWKDFFEDPYFVVFRAVKEHAV